MPNEADYRDEIKILKRLLLRALTKSAGVEVSWEDYVRAETKRYNMFPDGRPS